MPDRLGPVRLRRARRVRAANGRRWCWGRRTGHGACRIRQVRRLGRRIADPSPAHGPVRACGLSRCMDCGRASGACPWLFCTRHTGSRRIPGAGSRRWSIPCTSNPPSEARHVWGTSPAKAPAGHPRFMGYRHNGCRRHGRRPSMRRLQGLLVAPCRTAMIISIGKRKAPDPSGMVQVLLQITRTHPLAQAACRPARPD